MKSCLTGLVPGLLCFVAGSLSRTSSASSNALPDLVPYHPAAWSEQIVISVAPGSTTDSPSFSSADTLYVDWAVRNNGNGATSASFSNALYVDDVLRTSWTSAVLPAHSSVSIQDYALGWLSPGTHTLKIVADSGEEITESNETNNAFTKTINVTTALPAIRVDPTQLVFTGAPPSEGETTVQDLDSAEAPGDATASSLDTAPSSAGADKLVEPDQLLHGFSNGSTVEVIVTLAGHSMRPRGGDFHSRKSVWALQSRIRNAQDEVLNSVSARHLQVRHRFDNIAGFSADVTADGLSQLQSNPNVLAIEPVYTVEAHLAQGIPLIHGMTYRSSYNGIGVAVAICDTGIDYHHQRLGNGGFPNSKVIGGYNFGDNSPDPMADGQAHGTACSGIAAGDFGTVGDYIGGVAPNAKLYALKITAGSSGSASSDTLVAAWDWCVTHQFDNPDFPIVAISTSFGGGRFYASCDAALPSMTAAANNAAAAGMTILVSSGNDGYCDSIAWPACISSVIAVGATYDASFGDFLACINSASCVAKLATSGCATGWYCDDVTVPDRVASYSNAASFLGLLAPASACYTLDISGAPGYSSDDYYPGFGGTSAACPYAAGAVACLQSAAKALTGALLSTADVTSRLTGFGDLITDPKTGIGTPRINLERAIQSLANSSQSFRIHNDGPGLLLVDSVAAESSAPWLNFAPSVPFQIPGGQYQDVTVNVDFSQVPPGQSMARLLVTSSDTNNSPYPGAVYITAINTNNTPPSISAISDQTTTANASSGPIAFVVSDAETPAADLTLSANSSDPILVPVSNITFGGSGSNRTVTILPATNVSGTCSITLTVSDGSLIAQTSFGLKVAASLVGRLVFYNNSSFDGNDPDANPKDDAAIAIDKTALLPGGASSFQNYTSYSRGINGIMADIAGLPGTPLASDFSLKVGNDANPGNWAAGPSPVSVAVRAGAGTNGSSRVTLIWPDNAIQKEWLEVTVLPTVNTGLAIPSVFYFGNAIGETGDVPGKANVLINDALLILSNLSLGVSITNPLDIDRDGKILVNDALACLASLVAGAQALQVIDLSGMSISSVLSQPIVTAGFDDAPAGSPPGSQPMLKAAPRFPFRP